MSVVPPDLPGEAGPVVDAPGRGRLRARWVLAGAAGLLGIAFVLWWFQPQALLFDDVVDEAFPDVAAADAADETVAVDEADETAAREDEEVDPEAAEPAASEPTPSGPIELATGSFVSRNRYTVTGTATTYQLDDGERVLRLEDFDSTNGPDLFVYLTVAGTADDDAALDADFVDLGALTGNIGDQNYAIPADVDLDRYDSVVIWCRRFTTSFGVADLG
jgi:hypothetical protein